MRKVKFVILGAGPSGLAFARQLQLLGEQSFLLIEREAEVGGLCRSQRVEGVDVDVGGGHFLDVRNRQATEFLFSHLPREFWQEYSRVSKIDFGAGTIDYPFEASIWQLPLPNQIRHLDALARAGNVVGKAEPRQFEDWIRWKVGDAIADDYLLPYNRKLWGRDLNKLGTYWISKLPTVSFRETLEACLTKSARGTIPAHAEFFYPVACGYGAVWKEIASHFSDRIALNTSVHAIDGTIVNDEFEGRVLINTIPWSIWPGCGDMPSDIADDCRALEAASIDVDLYLEDVPSNAQWIYVPDEAKSFHRILVMNNFGCHRNAYWTETNAHRSPAALMPGAVWRHRNEFAYPVPTIDKPMRVRRILEWAGSNDIFGLGRWGEWEHYNSDVCVSKAIELARKLAEEVR